jgi:hypothetical protein
MTNQMLPYFVAFLPGTGKTATAILAGEVNRLGTIVGNRWLNHSHLRHGRLITLHGSGILQ